MDSDSIAARGALALACSLIVSWLAAGQFYSLGAFFWLLALLVGLIAALACRNWFIAAPAAALGVIVGTLLGAPHGPTGLQKLGVLGAYWLVAVLAALIGGAAAFLLSRRPNLATWLAWIGVALVVVATCWAGWSYANTFSPYVGGTPIEYFKSTPTMSANTLDPEIWILTVRRMHDGMSYYAAMGKTLTELNSAASWGFVDTTLPASYHMPTLYWLLAALPQNGSSWVLAMLTLVALGVLAAWSLTQRFVTPALALTGTSVAGAFFSSFTYINMPLAEGWAGMLALVSVALAVKSLSVRRRALVWASVAAVVALLAALTREPAAGFLIVGLASTLVAKRVRDFRLWIPWAAAIGILVALYLINVQACVAIARTLPPPPATAESGLLSYFDPTGAGLVACVGLLATCSWWAVPVAWVVWALGTVGGALAPRDWPRRVLLGGVTVGGAAALFFLHSVGAPGMPAPSTWGYLMLPTPVACATLAFARVRGLGRG